MQFVSVLSHCFFNKSTPKTYQNHAKAVPKVFDTQLSPRLAMGVFSSFIGSISATVSSLRSARAEQALKQAKLLQPHGRLGGKTLSDRKNKAVGCDIGMSTNMVAVFWWDKIVDYIWYYMIIQYYSNYIWVLRCGKLWKDINLWLSWVQNLFCLIPFGLWTIHFFMCDLPTHLTDTWDGVNVGEHLVLLWSSCIPIYTRACYCHTLSNIMLCCTRLFHLLHDRQNGCKVSSISNRSDGLIPDGHKQTASQTKFVGPDVSSYWCI